MDEEKRLCPNCGKELTKSARKCKYCETRIVPVKIQTTREEKLMRLLVCVLFLVIVAIVGTVLVLLCKGTINTLSFVSEHIEVLLCKGTINVLSFVKEHIDWWSVLKFIGVISVIILFIIITVIAYISGVLINKKFYKILFGVIIGVAVLNLISEHLEEIMFILGGILILVLSVFFGGGSAKEDVNVGSVIIKGSNATIYDISGTKLETISVIEPATLMSCGGKHFTLRCKNRIETYEYRGGLFGFIRISSRST